jgi:hypothetical protein
MKKIMNTIIILGMLGMSTLGGSTFIKADEIGNTVATENVGTVNNDVNTDTQTTTHHFHRPVYSFVRGTVGKYGKRPIIYRSQVTSKQWHCLLGISGTMLLSAATSNPYLMVGNGLLAYNSCF